MSTRRLVGLAAAAGVSLETVELLAGLRAPLHGVVVAGAVTAFAVVALVIGDWRAIPAPWRSQRWPRDSSRGGCVT